MLKTTNISRLLGATLVVLFLSGCTQDRAKEVDSENHPLVRINGRTITKEMLREEAEFRYLLDVNRQKSKKPQKSNEARLRKKAEQVALSSLVIGCLYATEFDNAGYRIDEDTYGRMTTNLYRRTTKTRQGEDGFKDLLKENKCDTIIPLIVEFEAKIKGYFLNAMSNDYVVTEEDIDNLEAQTKRYNETAALTNALAYAKATNILNKAQSGADFAKLADEYSEDPERQPGGELGLCTEEEFSDQTDYWARLIKLADGKISPILQTDVGLEIVRVNRREERKDKPGQFYLDLSRIYIRLPYFYPELDRPTYRAEIARQRYESCLQDSFPQLWKRAQVEYFDLSASNSVRRIVVGMNKEKAHENNNQ